MRLISFLKSRRQAVCPDQTGVIWGLEDNVTMEVEVNVGYGDTITGYASIPLTAAEQTLESIANGYGGGIESNREVFLVTVLGASSHCSLYFALVLQVDATSTNRICEGLRKIGSKLSCIHLSPWPSTERRPRNLQGGRESRPVSRCAPRSGVSVKRRQPRPPKNG